MSWSFCKNEHSIHCFPVIWCKFGVHLSEKKHLVIKQKKDIELSLRTSYLLICCSVFLELIRLLETQKLHRIALINGMISFANVNLRN